MLVSLWHRKNTRIHEAPDIFRIAVARLARFILLTLGHYAPVQTTIGQIRLAIDAESADLAPSPNMWAALFDFHLDGIISNPMLGPFARLFSPARRMPILVFDACTRQEYNQSRHVFQCLLFPCWRIPQKAKKAGKNVAHH
jgi:hypothetical protein